MRSTCGLIRCSSILTLDAVDRPSVVYVCYADDQRLPAPTTIDSDEIVVASHRRFRDFEMTGSSRTSSHNGSSTAGREIDPTILFARTLYEDQRMQSECLPQGTQMVGD